MGARLGIFWDLVFVVPAAFVLVSGGYSGGGLSLIGTFYILLLAIGLIRWSLQRQDSRSQRSALLSGIAVLTAAFALVEQTGALRSELSPVILATVAFLLAFNDRKVVLALVVTALSYELLLWAATVGDLGARDLQDVVIQSAMILLFAGLSQVHDSTASRRWLSSCETTPGSISRGSRPQETTDEAIAITDDIALVHLGLPLINALCDGQASCLLQAEDNSGSLTVTASTSAHQIGVVLSAHAGIQGSVLRSQQPVIVNHLREALPGAFLGPDGRNPLHVMASPVLRGDDTLGMVLVQRTEARPFSDAELRHLRHGAELIAKALVAERSVARVTEAYGELERFFAASRLLNEALTPEQVYESAGQALALIADFDFSVFTWISEADDGHRVVHASGDCVEGSSGKEVDPERSLAAMVVKNGHYLPIGCEFRGDGVPVLGVGEQLRGLRSVIALPLRIRNRVRGVLAVGSSQPNAFSEQRRGILEVIANQAAVSLSNALTYAKVQEMATTDALTGLFNRRSFETRLREGFARAERSNSPLTIVVFDIDHFKSINDTYGHPCGDTVLSQLGVITNSLLRRTDIAARTGGEEFALILEDTALEGALVMAERLREVTSALKFEGPKGEPFGITISLGVACFPIHGEDPLSLTKIADRALYQSKHGGRDRVTVAETPRRPDPSLSGRISQAHLF
jgi:diguanylate cyclase (GGDEF)-like protein